MIDKLVIGPVTYRVKELDDLHSVDDDGKKKWLHGHIVYADGEIRVANDQAADRKVITVWHEAMHGILDNAGFTEHPEAAIIALGFGLVQLIRDNPQLVAMTQETPPPILEGN